jgi:hypothetical protein
MHPTISDGSLESPIILQDCRTAGIGSLGKLIFIGLAKGDIKTGTLELLFPHFSMGETPHALLQIFHDVSFKN